LAWTGVATVVVGAGLIIARLAGVDLVRGTRGRPAPWQFSIRSLLAWTALIAVVIGLARVMHAAPIWTEPDAFAQQQMIAFGLLGMTSALIAATAIWATLPVGRLWWRLVLLAILAPAAMVLSRYMMGVTLGESVTSIDWFWILFGWLQAVILAGTLLVVRGCGYRLIKRRKSVWQWLSGRVRKQPSDGPPALPAEVAP
jgi:hypothetical protein